MSNKEILNTIKSTVHTFLPDSRVLLFGSRATGKANKDSDYDVLVVTLKTFSERAKLNWESKIHEAVVEAIDAPVDIVINSNAEISYKKKIHGHYIFNALKEAIEL